MSKIYLLRLSWPDKALWQNRRANHWAVARKTKAYREEARVMALHHGVNKLNTTTPRLVFAFHRPSGPGRPPDIHNMPATMKAAIDGIADAIGCDDSGFRCAWPETFEEPVRGGAVLIEVSE